MTPPTDQVLRPVEPRQSPKRLTTDRASAALDGSLLRAHGLDVSRAQADAPELGARQAPEAGLPTAHKPSVCSKNRQYQRKSLIRNADTSLHNEYYRRHGRTILPGSRPPGVFAAGGVGLLGNPTSSLSHSQSRGFQ